MVAKRCVRERVREGRVEYIVSHPRAALHVGKWILQSPSSCSLSTERKEKERERKMKSWGESAGLEANPPPHQPFGKNLVILARQDLEIVAIPDFY